MSDERHIEALQNRLRYAAPLEKASSQVERELERVNVAKRIKKLRRALPTRVDVRSR